MARNERPRAWESFWWDPKDDPALYPLQVHEGGEFEKVETGILDADGNMITRPKMRRRVGFIPFPSEEV